MVEPVGVDKVNLMGLDRRVFGWSWCNRRTLVTEPLVGEHYFNLE